MSDSNPPSERFLARCEMWFERALDANLPPFLMNPNDSNPINATPYITRYARFREVAGQWEGRSELLIELDSVLEKVGERGLAVDAILLGGSCIDRKLTHINDIDCLMFYRMGESGDARDGPVSLASLQEDAKQRGIDVRFAPLDGDPLTFIKLTAYFAILYSMRKGQSAIARSVLLLDCRGYG